MNASPNQPLSLKEYYTSAKGITTAAAAVVVPFASSLLGRDVGAYVFPPLGGIEMVARIGLVALSISMSILVYFLAAVQRPKSPLRVALFALAAGVVFLLAYLAAYQRFVLRIDIPARDSSAHVSIGYTRTPFAERTFGDASDWEMLQARGIEDEQIERLWTVKSVILARLTLYLSCSLATLSFLFLFSFAVAHDATHTASPPEAG